MKYDKNIFSGVMKQYGFLDDYEEEVNRRNLLKRGVSVNKDKNNESSNKKNLQQEKKYLNNYPDFDKMDQDEKNQPIQEDEQNSKNYYSTRYGRFTENSLDPNKLDDEEYVYKSLQVDRNASSNEEMMENSDKQLLGDANEVLKNREIKFYAFLNKEFNILNKKMIKCSAFCYSDPKMFSVYEAKICAEKCHKNIQEASKFAENIQEEKKENLLSCIENAREYRLDSGDDKVSLFFKCYESLLLDFDTIEEKIKNEFANYI
jgi:hypothetical protein